MAAGTPNDVPAALAPLADRMRPRTLAEMAGQAELLGPDRPLRRLIETDTLPSLILWGPPGCGKTTLARLMAAHARANFLEYSAVAVGSREVKTAMAAAERLRRTTGQRTLLFLDEIHRFNKAQQDALLPWVERGDITLIGATTENPSFEVIGALLSRTRLFVLAPLTVDDLVGILRRAVNDPRGLGSSAPAFTAAALQFLAQVADGDARVALNLLETAAAVACGSRAAANTTAPPVSGHTPEPTPERARTSPVDVPELELLLRHRLLRHDKNGEEHFNLISALHKSLRNSDVQAGLYWLARMLEAGEDPLYVARRLVRFASEDIGLADPQALLQALAARDTVHFLGQPEGKLALAQATVYLALAPKSNTLYTAYGEAARTAVEEPAYPVPLQIRNAPTALMRELDYGRGYVYAHDTLAGIAPMESLPPALAGREFYRPTTRGFEARLAERLERIKEWHKRQPSGDQTGGSG